MSNFYGSICVSDIPKECLTTATNGKMYLNISMVETPNNNYGNSHLIAVSIKKELQVEGRKYILGNMKVSAPYNGGSNHESGTPKPASAPIPSAPEDDLPF